MSRKHLVAIIGRPNVGKSSFFNYVTGRRISIVEDTPGVTRDRIYSPVEWSGRTFTMVDTGGLEPEATDNILRQMRRQAEIATELADVILFMVDAKDGVVASDKDIATFMRKTHKPVILVVNKVDDFFNLPDDIYEFYNLGLGDYYCISSAHGLGIGEVLDAVLEKLPADDEEDEDENVIKVAVCGKPNAGKSSLINKILGEDRVIVSDVAGTTRDVVEDTVRLGNVVLHLADTAGIHSTGNEVEKIGVDFAVGRVERAMLVLAVFDLSRPFDKEDEEIIQLCKGKLCVAVANKDDMAADFDRTRLDCFENVVYISAKQGKGADELAAAVEKALGTNNVDTSAALLANERQRLCCEKAVACIKEAIDALKSGYTLDAVTVSTDAAVDELLALTGEKAGDAVVSEIFSRFCVGK